MTIPLEWIECGTWAIASFNLAFGIFTAVWPQKSIGLDVWMMKLFNWEVRPADEMRELRSTRFLGTLLVVLSLAIFFLRLS